MSGIWIVFAAVAVLGLSGVPGLALPRRSSFAQRVATILMVAGSVLGLCGLAAPAGGSVSLRIPWGLPLGEFAIAVDPISSVFLGLVFIVPALGSVYGLSYWSHPEHPDTGRRLGLFYGVLAGSMGMVLLARDAVLFLMAWEVMAIAAYFAATVEEDDAAVRRAGWVYLIATHVGTLCLIAMFALWRHATGSFALEPVQAMPAQIAGPIFVLAVIGFGAKAGLMPLHVWLPGAHAGAPSHVSAVMSGVMLAMGVYGIVRMTAVLPIAAAWWGGSLLVVGAATGVAGIAFALGQHDLKRLLAYSSIENIGIIAMGLGLALLGRSLHRPDWTLLGLGGALFHACNHGLFKSLLFLGAGAVLHATHTREMDRLGGLGKRMPRMMGLFVVGSMAISGLPPLNGFASEWLVYVGLFRTLGIDGAPGYPPLAAAVVVLAAIGALSAVCFVKLVGTVFLGTPRSSACEHAKDPPAIMIVPMAILALLCIGVGLYPALAAPMLEHAVATWAGTATASAVTLTTLAPLGWIASLGALLVLLTAIVAVAFRTLPGASAAGETGTWDCGYAQPTRRMQYTGSSFAQSVVEQFRFVLWPRSHRPVLHGAFPLATTFKSVIPDSVLDRVLLPLFRVAGRYLPMVRVFQQGQIQSYVLYVLVVLIVLLVWGPMGVQP